MRGGPCAVRLFRPKLLKRGSSCALSFAHGGAALRTLEALPDRAKIAQAMAEHKPTRKRAAKQKS
jgi:hypothetical protein